MSEDHLIVKGARVHNLKNLDVDLRKIRLEVEKLVQSGPDMVTMGKLPQTPRAKKVIEYAIEEARNLNHNYVGTEHLLLGLIREGEGGGVFTSGMNRAQAGALGGLGLVGYMGGLGHWYWGGLAAAAGVKVAFTPDEEVGAGTKFFDVKAFGAACAYTVDGDRVGELNKETFSADTAVVTASYQVFVHLLDGQGALRAQLDSVPAQGAASFEKPQYQLYVEP